MTATVGCAPQTIWNEWIRLSMLIQYALICAAWESRLMRMDGSEKRVFWMRYKYRFPTGWHTQLHCCRCRCIINFFSNDFQMKIPFQINANPHEPNAWRIHFIDSVVVVAVINSTFQELFSQITKTRHHNTQSALSFIGSCCCLSRRIYYQDRSLLASPALNSFLVLFRSTSSADQFSFNWTEITSRIRRKRNNFYLVSWLENVATFQNDSFCFSK